MWARRVRLATVLLAGLVIAGLVTPISEKALGPDHPTLAASLINLARHYKERGEYDRADALYEDADRRPQTAADLPWADSVSASRPLTPLLSFRDG